jgi:Na+/melibiose symporter-like transporter
MGGTGVDAIAAKAGQCIGTDPRDEESGQRPTDLLPISHLLRISAYWLGLTTIDSAVGLFISNRLEFDHFVTQGAVGTSLYLIGLGVATVSILIQPTVGYISDFWESHWGRRKPFIVVGSLFDVVFLAGIALAGNVYALAAYVILLQLSTNTARGPFQGYVPDMVAEPQVGMASGMVGLMQIAGNVTGYGLVALAVRLNAMPIALLAVAVIELASMASVVLRVGKGLPPRPRRGRSWATIAREAWATDILRERSYVWLLFSRLLFLGGGALLVNFVLIFLSRALDMDKKGANDTQLLILGVVVVANLIAMAPHRGSLIASAASR